MFKRIIAFTMCALMVLGMMGCSKDPSLDYIAGMESRSDNAPMTISLYVPSLAELSNETREAVEEALNAISVKKYNTTLKFYAYPEEQYVPIVLSKVQTAMNSYVTYLISQDPNNKLIEKPIDYSVYGDVRIPDNLMTEHPELADAGIDIFVAFDAADDSIMHQEFLPNPEDPENPKPNPYYNPYMADNLYNVLHAERALEPITPRLINDYAILNSKCYPEFFSKLELKDVYADPTNENPKYYAHAMPNNYIIGSYKYLVINRDVVSEIYSQDYDALVKAGEDLNAYYANVGKNKPYATNEEAFKAWEEAKYKGVNQLKKDLEKLKANGNAKLEKVKNIFVEFDSYEDYQEFDESFAFAMVTGDLALPSVIANENYDIVKFCASAYDKNEFATSMYCITRAYDPALMSSNIDDDDRVMRCLDIIMLIQNDVDFRNTLQYGVKGEHYTISRDGTVYTSSNEYVMDPTRLGNMFLLYPSDRMSPSMRKMAENNWRLAKAQNKEILDSKIDTQS